MRGVPKGAYGKFYEFARDIYSETEVFTTEDSIASYVLDLLGHAHNLESIEQKLLDKRVEYKAEGSNELVEFIDAYLDKMFDLVTGAA